MAGLNVIFLSEPLSENGKKDIKNLEEFDEKLSNLKIWMGKIDFRNFQARNIETEPFWAMLEKFYQPDHFDWTMLTLQLKSSITEFQIKIFANWPTAYHRRRQSVIVNWPVKQDCFLGAIGQRPPLRSARQCLDL